MSMGDRLLSSLVDRAVRKFHGLPDDCRQSGDDSGLDTVWDEFKDQIRHGESVMFRAYEDTLLTICEKLVGELDKINQSRLWLMTEASDAPDREPGIPYGAQLNHDVSEFIYAEVVNRATEEANSPDECDDQVACVCEEGGASAAYKAFRSGPTLHSFVDRSHFTVEMTSCEGCDRPALEIWHEVVNFFGDDDDHTTFIAPVDEEASTLAIQAGDWKGLLQSLDDDLSVLRDMWPDRSTSPGPAWVGTSVGMKILFGRDSKQG